MKRILAAVLSVAAAASITLTAAAADPVEVWVADYGITYREVDVLYNIQRGDCLRTGKALPTREETRDVVITRHLLERAMEEYGYAAPRSDVYTEDLSNWSTESIELSGLTPEEYILWAGNYVLFYETLGELVTKEFHGDLNALLREVRLNLKLGYYPITATGEGFSYRFRLFFDADLEDFIEMITDTDNTGTMPTASEGLAA